MNMTIERRPFGVTAESETVWAYVLQNEFLTAEVLTWGASLRRLVFRDVDVVLGYDSLEDYIRSDGYMGATVGRVCNRIGGAAFVLDSGAYPLAKNDGNNHLHGGVRGFDRYVWDAEIAADGVRFSRTSPDGEEGYPGALTVSVTYRLSGAALSLEYSVQSDKSQLFQPQRRRHGSGSHIDAGSRNISGDRPWMSAYRAVAAGSGYTL